MQRLAEQVLAAGASTGLVAAGAGASEGRACSVVVGREVVVSSI